MGKFKLDWAVSNFCGAFVVTDELWIVSSGFGTVMLIDELKHMLNVLRKYLNCKDRVKGELFLLWKSLLYI